MSDKLLTPIEIGLTAAIVAIEDNEPQILTASGSDGDRLTGLPFGPFDAVAHRTFEIGLRAWVEEQTGLRLGYVEQLYTFGDRGRHAQPGDTDVHVASIGYLALTRTTDIERRACARRGLRALVPILSLGGLARATGPRSSAATSFRSSSKWAEQGDAPETTRALPRKRPGAALFRHRRRPLGRGACARPLRAAL